MTSSFVDHILTTQVDILHGVGLLQLELSNRDRVERILEHKEAPTIHNYCLPYRHGGKDVAPQEPLQTRCHVPRLDELMHSKEPTQCNTPLDGGPCEGEPENIFRLQVIELIRAVTRIHLTQIIGCVGHY